jgi:hypothetical protein
MPSLLLVMFILQLSLHLINTVGVNTLNELVRRAPRDVNTRRQITTAY